MTPQQYQRLTELFHAAMEMALDRRAAFLDQVSGDDVELRTELESLLATREQGALTEKPPDDIAAGYMAQHDGIPGIAPSLFPNTRLDHYVIHSLLGNGGMGEVYLAQDTSLHRLVALKLLPPSSAVNKDRMHRFVQEARAAAALSPPHIAQIFEIGEHDGTHFIAMEFVDGVTLRTKIYSEHTELRLLLKYLQQVVEGLAKAHAAGIVHRDLKPDNIMITRDDYAKILDFGLAKLMEPQKSVGSDTVPSSEVSTSVMAQQSLSGMVMGTAGYMSPEQAQGKVNEIDQRSDIFSFGCVLFEAVTAHRPFADDSLSKTLDKVVNEAAPLIKDFNPSAPPDLQRIIHRCLAKDREDRYQTIKEVAVELKELRRRIAERAEIDTTVRSSGSTETLVERTTEQSATTTPTTEYLVSNIKQHKRRMIIAGSVAMAIIAGVWFLLQDRGFKPNSMQRVTLKRLTPDIYAIDPTLSPNGEYLAYVKLEKGLTSIWLRSMVSGNTVQTMPANIEGYGELQFSPDGKQLYYLTYHRDSPNATICRVSTFGGIPQDIARDVFSPFALSPDGKQLAFVRARSLVIAGTDGHSERELFKLPSGMEYFVIWGSQLSWSPDGSRIVVCGGRTEQGHHHAKLFAISVSDGARQILPTPNWNKIEDAMWLADGASLLVTAREQEGEPFQIWRVSYPNGQASRVTEDSNNYDGISLTADSQTLVVEQAFSRQNIWLASLSDTKNTKPLTSSAVAADGYSGIAFAPDDTIIFTSPRSGNVDLWRMNADGGNQQQLTMNAGSINFRPSVTPDGRYIVFVSSRTGTAQLWRMDVDGRNAIRLTDSPSPESLPFLSADGQWIYYQRYNEDGPATMKVSINGGSFSPLSSKVVTHDAVPSPDGKLLACSVYIDKSEQPWKVAIISTESGETLKLLDLPAFRNLKRWTSDSKSLIYISGPTAELWQQPIDSRPPTKLFTLSNERLYYFAISPDFKKIAYSLGNEFSEAVLISNWKTISIEMPGF